MIKVSAYPHKTEMPPRAVTALGWLFFVSLIYAQEQVVLYSNMLNVLLFGHSLRYSLRLSGLSRGNVSMYATFLLSEKGVLMLLIKRKPLQAQRLYCLSNYRLSLCSVGAGQQITIRHAWAVTLQVTLQQNVSHLTFGDMKTGMLGKVQICTLPMTMYL